MERKRTTLQTVSEYQTSVSEYNRDTTTDLRHLGGDLLDGAHLLRVLHHHTAGVVVTVPAHLYAANTRYIDNPPSANGCKQSNQRHNSEDMIDATRDVRRI